MQVGQIIEALSELETDSSVPRNVKLKITCTIASLREEQEKNLAISRAICDLGQIADDCNMQAHVRTQIFSIVSMLENTHI